MAHRSNGRGTTTMRLLYKAVAVGAAGAAGITPLATAAHAALTAQELRVDRCGQTWNGTLELCAAGETSYPGTGPAGDGYGHDSGYGPNDTNDWQYDAPTGVGTGGPLYAGQADDDDDAPGYGNHNHNHGGIGTTGGGTGTPGVSGVPAGSVASAATGTVTATGTLPVTGTSAMMTTIGFAFIIGGAGILYFTRLGDRGEEQTPTKTPATRTPVSKGPAAPRPRRRPSPQATRRS